MQDNSEPKKDSELGELNLKEAKLSIKSSMSKFNFDFSESELDQKY